MSRVSNHLYRLARQYNVMWIMCRDHFRSDGKIAVYRRYRGSQSDCSAF